jgi:hypothetical protein
VFVLVWISTSFRGLSRGLIEVMGVQFQYAGGRGAHSGSGHCLQLTETNADMGSNPTNVNGPKGPVLGS